VSPAGELFEFMMLGAGWRAAIPAMARPAWWSVLLC